MSGKNPFALVFDLSFTEFVTTRLIRGIFVLGVIVSGLWSLRLLVLGLRAGFFSGLLHLVLSLVLFFLSVMFVRVWCELVMVFFRIAENTGRLVEQAQKAP